MLYKRSVLDGLAKEGRKASVRFDGDQGVRSEIKSTTNSPFLYRRQLQRRHARGRTYRTIGIGRSCEMIAGGIGAEGLAAECSVDE